MDAIKSMLLVIFVSVSGYPVSGILNAQTIIVSEEIPLRSDVSYDVIGEFSGKLLMSKDETSRFSIMAYDKNLQLAWEKDLELDKRTPKVMDISSRPNDFTVLYRYRSRNHTVLKAHKYNAAANLIDSVQIVDLGYLFYVPEIETYHSEDHSKVLFTYSERQDLVRMVVFDTREMKLVSDRVITMREYLSWDDFSQYIVANDGIVHLIMAKNNYYSRRAKHRYLFYEFPPGDALPLEYSMQLDSNITYDVLFEYDNINNQIVGAGLYSERNTAIATGSFYVAVGKNDSSAYVLQFTPFDREIINAISGKIVTSDNRGLEEFVAQHLQLREDGGILLISEKIRESDRRTLAPSPNQPSLYFDPYTSQRVADYYYDDMLVTALNPDGSVHWTRVLPKKQYSQGDNAAYSSYFLFLTQAKMRLLFNDEIKQTNTVSEYVLNGIGEMDRNSLLSTETMDIKLRFRDGIQIAENQMVIPSEKRNRLRLVKVIYE